MTDPAAGKTLIVKDAAGGFTLDAEMLAEHFGWSPDELREMMKRGLVASRVERGEGDDRGRWRLSVRCGNRQWQAVMEPDGAISNQQVDFVTTKKGP